MSHSKNSTKGSHNREADFKKTNTYIGYAYEAVSSIDGKRFFKRYVGKVNRRTLNKEVRHED